MRSLISLFVRDKRTSKNSRRNAPRSYKPTFERLDDLILPSAGVSGNSAISVVLPSSVSIYQEPTDTINIRPGQTKVAVATVDVSAKFADGTIRQDKYLKVTGVDIVSMQGSEPLSWNSTNITVTCGSVNEGSTQADYNTDVAKITAGKPNFLVHPDQTLKFQVLVDFSGGFSGKSFGVEVAGITLATMSTNLSVPESVKSYSGAGTLHVLDNASFDVFQQTTVASATTHVGDTGVNLLTFSTSSVDSTNQTVTVTGVDTSTIANPVITQDTNWDGKPDTSAPGKVVGGDLVFPVNAGSSGVYSVNADVVASPVSNVIQASLHTDGTGISATSTDTGNPLQGVRVNGAPVNGAVAPQMGIWTQNAPLYVVASATPTVKVTETAASQSVQIVNTGDKSVVGESFTVRPTSSITVTNITENVAYGSMSTGINYALFVNGVNVGAGRVVGTGNTAQLSFDTNVTLVANQDAKFEVREDISSSAQYGTVFKLQMAGGGKGLTAKTSKGDLIGKELVDTVFADQPELLIGGWNYGGMGAG